MNSPGGDPGSGCGSGSGPGSEGRTTHGSGRAGPQGSLAERRETGGTRHLRTAPSSRRARWALHFRLALVPPARAACHATSASRLRTSSWTCHGRAKRMRPTARGRHEKEAVAARAGIPPDHRRDAVPTSSEDSPQTKAVPLIIAAAGSQVSGAEKDAVVAVPQLKLASLRKDPLRPHNKPASARMPLTTGSGGSTPHATPRFSPTKSPLPANDGPRFNAT